MLDKIEKHLETMKIEEFSLSDLKLYTEIAIELDRYKNDSCFLKKIKDISGLSSVILK